MLNSLFKTKVQFVPCVSVNGHCGYIVRRKCWALGRWSYLSDFYVNDPWTNDIHSAYIVDHPCSFVWEAYDKGLFNVKEVSPWVGA